MEYKVIRHIQFYAKSEILSLEQLAKFFTPHAVKEYIKYGYLEKVEEDK
jgi:hypothetical protein